MILRLWRTVSLSVKGNTYSWPHPRHHTRGSSKVARVSRTHMTGSIRPGIIRETCRLCVGGRLPLLHSFGLDRIYHFLKVKQAAHFALKNGEDLQASAELPGSLWEDRANLRCPPCPYKCSAHCWASPSSLAVLHLCYQ